MSTYLDVIELNKWAGLCQCRKNRHEESNVQDDFSQNLFETADRVDKRPDFTFRDLIFSYSVHRSDWNCIRAYYNTLIALTFQHTCFDVNVLIHTENMRIADSSMSF